MSFYRIDDPKKRDAMIEESIATAKRLRERSLNERQGEFRFQKDMEKQFQPVVKSNEKMMKELAKHIKPIREEVETLKDYVKQEDEEEELPHKRRRVGNEYDGYGPLASAFKAKVLANDRDIDTGFGIYFLEDGRTKMGNKTVTISNDDIIVDHEVYDGTPGLWRLITGTRPDQLTRSDDNWTLDDMKNYYLLVKQTNVLHKNFDPRNPSPRANGSWKWKHILKKIWNQDKNSDDDDDDDDDDDEVSGSGLHEIYLQKNGKCYQINVIEGDGLYLSPRHNNVSLRGDGLYVKSGKNVYDGKGLLLGKESPFKNIPILGWIL